MPQNFAWKEVTRLEGVETAIQTHGHYLVEFLSIDGDIKVMHAPHTLQPK